MINPEVIESQTVIKTGAVDKYFKKLFISEFYSSIYIFEINRINN
jgi:hypothetical protein